MRDLAGGDVDARPQAGVAPDRLGDAVVGERDRVGQGRVGEGVGRGDRDRAGHVGDAVVGDPVDLEGRVAVGGRARGLEAAALVDRDVDQHRAGLHQRQLLAPHHVGRAGAVDEHGADHQVGPRQHLLDRQRGRVDGRAAAAEGDVELAQAVDRAVEDEDVGLHPDRDEGGVHADHAAADHHHVGGGDAGHAAEQDAAPAERLLEHEGAGLGGDLAGDLAHRRQQRQPPARVLDRLVGDAGRAGPAEAAGLLGVRRQVQVGEEQLAGAQHLDLRRLQLLDVEDHLGLARRPSAASATMRRALRLELGVGDRAALAGAGLDQHLVAVLGHFADAGRGDRDPVLVGLDLGRHPDLHATSSRARRASQNSIRSWARERSRPVSSSTLRIR